ncbi:hypothetical protein M2480_000399 [Parabacteroides sp. PFB2-12]|uniref:META domain-containing protein n=1 Tax=unclassified Parabacteroides TaxID=2649774 RepID=UPI002474E872|nr:MULTISPECIES: META domain-containing protein [unclassified Parabacteroides]MDH6341249.1 hypothetical protein [Parabacteroides sp. PM6-13]MDH6389439.1 hypothetical protein [Parabacteroides sp. PFB2-12]
MRHLSYLLLFLFAMLSGGCSKDDDMPQDLVGTWQCVGFGERNNAEIKAVEPQDCTSCYVLEIKENGDISGATTTNSFSGKISYKSQSIKIVDILITKVGEKGDGYIYFDRFLETNSYIRTLNDLQLFYEDNSYLLYKRITP